MSRILMVYTSVNETLTGGKTGWYLPEAAHPYYTFIKDFEVDFASPAGPNPPVDPSSVVNFTDDESQSFLKDPTVQDKFSSALRLVDVDYTKYAAIFYVGGHGPVIDLPTDPANIELANKFYRSGKLVTAVCHGPAALVKITDESGKSIFTGRTATGFSNDEEEITGTTKAIPFLLETRINELGGKYVKADAPWGVKVVIDGNLLTGQNPASAKSLGEAIVKALKA